MNGVLNSPRIRIGFQFWLKTKRRETTSGTKQNTAILYSNSSKLKYFKRKINSRSWLVPYACAKSSYQISDRHAQLFVFMTTHQQGIAEGILVPRALDLLANGWITTIKQKNRWGCADENELQAEGRCAYHSHGKP